MGEPSNHKITQLYIILEMLRQNNVIHFDILCLITLVYSEVFGICHKIFDRYPTCNLNQEGNIRGVVLCRVFLIQQDCKAFFYQFL